MRYVVLLLLLPVAMAAELSGTVYDYDLQPLNNVVITVNTEPKQQQISKDGGYLFTLPVGEYLLRAEYKNDRGVVYYTEEPISVKANGEFTFDLILFPHIDEDLLSDIVIDVSDVSEVEIRWLVVVSIALVILVFIVGIYLIFLRKPKVDDDEVKKLILQILVKHRRITQKDIRKQVPFSEAKISLVISELVAEGRIKKIKKGRGNIIILA